MSEDKHSLMAERIGIGRALHQFFDPGPVIFEDPLARPLMGAYGEQFVQKNLAWLGQAGMRRTRTLVALRSRYTEEALRRAVAEGTRQYVILGAGLDSFAYRRPEWSAALTVYEVDQPGTQRWKQERLDEAGIAVPGNLRFVPLDFNKDSLAGGLAAAGFRPDAAAFFSWLGVVYYLPPESVMETLRYIGAHEAARQVVFDYAVDAATLPARYHEIVALVAGYTQRTGEPWKSWFGPESLMADLRALGFTSVTNVEFNDLLIRYRGEVDDDLTPMVALMSAQG
jgi:methyltransferase (TIGR00027 family)